MIVYLNVNLYNIKNRNMEENQTYQEILSKLSFKKHIFHT